VVKKKEILFLDMGRYIRSKREKLYRSRNHFASVISKSVDAVYSWEAGRDAPSDETLKRIAKFLNCDESKLLELKYKNKDKIPKLLVQHTSRVSETKHPYGTTATIINELTEHPALTEADRHEIINFIRFRIDSNTKQEKKTRK